MKNLVIYIHGNGGNINEADYYKKLFPDCDVKGMDYTSETPWDAVNEMPELYDKMADGYQRVTIIANSIGAYFAMCALNRKDIFKAYFISPIVDMEQVITDMMAKANVTEAELESKGEIDALSWDYLCYARENKPLWFTGTHIIYGSEDNLTDEETVFAFAKGHRSTVDVLNGGEHWFHTDEQMAFIADVIKKYESC